MANQVVANAELSGLLIGKSPKVFNLTESQSRRVKPPSSERSSVRFSPRSNEAIADEEPIERIQRKKAVESANIHTEVHNFSSTTNKIAEKCQAFENSHMMKARIRDMEYNDFYCRPLLEKIDRSFRGDTYVEFKAKQKKAIEEFDALSASYSTNSLDPPAYSVRISTKDLRDPVKRFFDKRKQEKKLMMFLTRSDGTAAPKASPRRAQPSLDYKAFDLLAHTKFFYGKDTEGARFGRKSFPMQGKSQVPDVLDSFRR